MRFVVLTLVSTACAALLCGVGVWSILTYSMIQSRSTEVGLEDTRWYHADGADRTVLVQHHHPEVCLPTAGLGSSPNIWR